LTDAANDAKEVGEFLAGTVTWIPGRAYFNALENAGEELRKAAGLSKLALDGGATLKQATRQTKVATEAVTDAQLEYASLSVSTNFECPY
jgi:hypothetical protein